MNEDVTTKLKLCHKYSNLDCFELSRLHDETWNDVNGDVKYNGRQLGQIQGICALLARNVQLDIIPNTRATLGLAEWL